MSYLSDTIHEPVFTFIWVTDPYNPDILPIHNSLINALSGPHYVVISSDSINLEQSILETTFVVKEININDSIAYESFILPQLNPSKVILEYIGKISYEPTSFTLEFINEPHADIINGLTDIVREYTELLLDTTVSKIETVRYIQPDNPSILVKFIPQLISGANIFRQNTELIQLYQTVDLHSLVGYQILSTDPLLNYALSNMSEIPPFDRKNFYNITMTKLNRLRSGSTSPDVLENQHVFRINAYIQRLRYEGYFTLPQNLYNIPNYEQLTLYTELATMMKIPIHQKDTIPLVLQSYLDFTIDIDTWFNQSVNYIQTGSVPRFIITGWWQYDSSVGGPVSPDNNSFRAKIYFAAFRAYIQLIAKNPILSPLIVDIRVLDDFSIEIPITSFSDVDIFRQALSITMTNIVQWYVSPSTSVLHSLLQRWFIIQNYKLPCMSIPINDTEFLVVQTSRNDLITIPSDLTETRLSLNSSLRQYYSQLCNSNIEPITLEQISQLDLDTLLQLIVIQTGNTQYCYTSSSLSNLPRATDPISRAFFTDTQTFMIHNHIWGLRGLFSLPLLPGLTDFPSRYLVPPPSGAIVVLSDTDSEQIDVDIITDSGEHIPLFVLDNNISTSDFKQLQLTLEQLWRCGWFLPPWASSYAYKTNTLSMYLYAPLNIPSEYLQYFKEAALRCSNSSTIQTTR